MVEVQWTLLSRTGHSGLCIWTAKWAGSIAYHRTLMSTHPITAKHNGLLCREDLAGNLKHHGWPISLLSKWKVTTAAFRALGLAAWLPIRRANIASKIKAKTRRIQVLRKTTAVQVISRICLSLMMIFGLLSSRMLGSTSLKERLYLNYRNAQCESPRSRGLWYLLNRRSFLVHIHCQATE